MSHFTKVRTQLRNMDTVKTALEDLGYTVETDAVVRGYQGQYQRADVVAKLNSQYDVGFRMEEDQIVAVADFWGVRVDRQKFMNKVAQRYAYITVKEQAEVQGWQELEEEVQPDGSIRLVMNRWA